MMRERSGPDATPGRNLAVPQQKAKRRVAGPAGIGVMWDGLPSERHRRLLDLLYANSHRDKGGRLVSWWPQTKLAERLGIKPRQLRNLLADLRQPGSDPRHPTGSPPGLRLGYVKVEPTTYTDRATGHHRLGGNLYVLVEHRQQAMPTAPVSAGDVNRQPPAVACLNEEPTASEERKVSSTSPTAVSNPCGWADCEHCAALVRFMEKLEAGEVEPRAPITSAWWESMEAEAVYARGVCLPLHQHDQGAHNAGEHLFDRPRTEAP